MARPKGVSTASFSSMKEAYDKVMADLADETKRADQNAETSHKWKSLADEREKIISEKNRQITDLKERLVNAESENQRMRGYIQRVQEDDVVREETVTIGDPNGEQQMVPKRKHQMFATPNSYSDAGMEQSGYDRYRDQRKSKHWVTY